MLFIYNCAQEMSAIAKIAAINQGVKVDELDSDKFFQNVSDVISTQVNALSDKGFKEVVKIDNKGLRFIPFEENDYEIELKCGKDNCPISKDDFEVKFVSGSFDSSNYSLADVNSSKLSASDKELAVSQCSNLDLSSPNSYLKGEQDDDDFEKIVEKPQNGKYNIVLVKQDSTGEQLN